MKTKTSFVFAILLLANIVICTQPISTGKAIDAAVHFFAQEIENSDVLFYAPAIGENQMATAKVLRYAERECMYAVSMPDSGWVLVAADERVAPILAISYNETFPAEGRELTLYLIQQEQTIQQLQEQINSLTL